MIVSDKIFFADPSTFNDPLDSKPNLFVDISVENLRNILHSLVRQRVSAELSSAAAVMKYSGPKTQDRIRRRSQRAAEDILAEISYNSGGPAYEMDDPEKYLLAYEIEKELLKRYDKGVFSLAERATCPLMWSHYGGQHRGVCLGYSVPDDVSGDLFKIDYGGKRLVDASSVAAMLEKKSGAQENVDGAVLLRKSLEWRYEREWRLLGTRGLQDSKLELEEITFGLRCTDVERYVIVKSLKDRGRPIKFFQICQQHGHFSLSKTPLDTSELCINYPRRARYIYEVFRDVSISEKPVRYNSTDIMEETDEATDSRSGS